MAKKNNKKIIYVCTKCERKTADIKINVCPHCKEVESLIMEPQPHRTSSHLELARELNEKPLSIPEIYIEEEERVFSGIAEFDRVLGGGLVKGSVVLIGGDPGIGKSTLLLQALDGLSRTGLICLYASGEESQRQIKMRAKRLGIVSPKLQVINETDLEMIIDQTERVKSKILVVDSVQTIHAPSLDSVPGSASQLRETSERLITYSKRSSLSTLLIGHVTKEGSIAGPKVIEHMVDTVLYFEGERGHSFRVLRAVKNRFGSTNEIGVFEMKEEGLCEVANPSEIFLSERPLGVPGSIVAASMEGTRPILVEIQALVTPSFLALPRRTTIGVDHNRAALIVAILEKKMKIKLFNQDIFINVAGGVHVSEPAVDLGVVVAVASSYLEKSLDPTTVFFGEVGLTGEIRAIAQAEARVGEARKMGFKRCILPQANYQQIRHIKTPALVGVSSLEDCWERLF